MKTVLIIPARFESSRFPGKPLAEIYGIPMLKRVYDRCLLAAKERDFEVYVATDDKRIESFCDQNGIPKIMTSKECKTGTDRLYEANQTINAELVINVQGDEPLVDFEDIIQVHDTSLENPESIVNCISPILSEEEFRSLAVPKMVFSKEMNLLYASRAPIPLNKKGRFQRAWKQVCIYSFPKDALKRFGASKNKTQFEEIEDIEINRFIELGLKVKLLELSSRSIAVDFPEDVKRVEALLNEQESK